MKIRLFQVENNPTCQQVALNTNCCILMMSCYCSRLFRKRQIREQHLIIADPWPDFSMFSILISLQNNSFRRGCTIPQIGCTQDFNQPSCVPQAAKGLCGIGQGHGFQNRPEQIQILDR